MKIIAFVMTALLALFLLAGCDKEPQTGPGKIRFDRETCERCLMAISDPNFAAEVRGGPEGKKTELYKFDDLGCAVIWLDQQPWKDNPRTEIWVTDYKTGEWIDARKASYVKNQLTPMNYGLGAQPQTAPGALNFAEAREHIYRVEEKYNLHNGTIHLNSSSATSTAGSISVSVATSTPAAQ